jgi:predicted membrane channel-forming protein YqfA (hemolysin III family)
MPPDDYQEHWRRYKKLRNVFFFLFLGYVPVVAAFTVLVSMPLRAFTPSFVFAVIWIVMLLVVGNRLSAWRCPRCGQWFAAKWWYNKGLFARKCVHCGLPKFAASGAPPLPR